MFFPWFLFLRLVSLARLQVQSSVSPGVFVACMTFGVLVLVWAGVPGTGGPLGKQAPL